MARRFKKKAGIPGVVSLPGLPGIGGDTIVEGDEYAKYCPHILEEVFDAPSKPLKAAPAQPAVSKPEPVSVPAVSDSEPEEDEDVEPPNMEWLKSELVEYAEGLGLSVDGMTKRQILDAIEEEETD